jgi:hypothetical protein
MPAHAGKTIVRCTALVCDVAAAVVGRALTLGLLDLRLVAVAVGFGFGGIVIVTVVTTGAREEQH